MVKIAPRIAPPPQAKHNPTILYLGQNADEICDLVSPHIGTIDISYAQDVGSALKLARAKQLDIVIVDQRDENLANKLILPLFADLGYAVKLVVVTTLSDVGSYLRVPGVARVITAPVRAQQLARVLGLDASKIRHDRIKIAEEVTKEAEAPKAPKVPFLIKVSNLGMQLVSTAYKRMAFILLGILFVSFTFYGVMIGFFLTSSGWGSPLTLATGRPTVDKVARDISDMKVALNLNSQRLTDANQKFDASKRGRDNAQILVNFASDTVDKEIVDRRRQIGVINRTLKRTKRVNGSFDRQLAKGGMDQDLAKLFAKRLIEKRVFESGTMGLLETGQRMAGMQTQLDNLQSDREALQQSITMLHSLRIQLSQAGPIGGVTAATSALLLLTKQAVDARAALNTAQGDFDAAIANTRDLQSSRYVLIHQIEKMENSALARASQEAITVMFVPYANQAQFKPGADLYSCRFTMVFCWKTGTIGDRLPGEVEGIHPFFGKQIRGFYMEAHLTDPIAATKEIIHANRPPLYFF
jgi:hypothetical protein